MKTIIKAEIVAHSVNEQGDELISVLATFPRIILAEVNTHRMLSKNTSSSRAIPFNKMVESIQNDPFIPIAWQKEHKGMQGTSYIKDELIISHKNGVWLQARDEAIFRAQELNGNLVRTHGFGLHEELMETGVTKQLCNRLLEPFMWTTMLITGSKEGWENFFKLRCPQYQYSAATFNSRKDLTKTTVHAEDFTELDWLRMNKGYAEIHISDLAEKIYDAKNESVPKVLKAGEWHIPFEDRINIKSFIGKTSGKEVYNLSHLKEEEQEGIIEMDKAYNKALLEFPIKISVAMAARTSYTVVGEEKTIDYEALVGLHDRLLAQDPPHSSPLEHCARAMSEDERNSFIKGNIHDFAERSLQKEIKEMTSKTFIVGEVTDKKLGWCNNFKGFIPYRYLVDNGVR